MKTALEALYVFYMKARDVSHAPHPTLADLGEMYVVMEEVRIFLNDNGEKIPSRWGDQ